MAKYYKQFTLLVLIIFSIGCLDDYLNKKIQVKEKENLNPVPEKLLGKWSYEKKGSFAIERISITFNDDWTGQLETIGVDKNFKQVENEKKFQFALEPNNAIRLINTQIIRENIPTSQIFIVGDYDVLKLDYEEVIILKKTISIN